MVSASEGGAVGDTILHYSSGNWTEVNSPANASLNSVYMVSASEGWAVGVGGYGSTGVILHYSGGRWAKVNTYATQDLRSVYMVSASEGWAVGVGGAIMHSSGDNWKAVEGPTNKDRSSA